MMTDTIRTFKQSNLKSRKLIYLCAFFWLGLFVSFYISAFSLVILMILMLSSINMKEDEIFSLLIFIVPFATVFKFESLSTSLFTFLEIFEVLLLLIRRKKLHFYFLITVFIAFIAFSVRLNSFIGVIEVIKVLLAFSIVYLFASGKDIKDNRSILWFFIAAILFSTLMGVFKENIPRLNSLVGEEQNYAWIDSIGRVKRFSGLNVDPNYYSIGVLLSILILFISLMKTDKRYLLLRVFLFILFSIFGILTISKSFFVCYCSIIIFVALCNVKKNLKVVLVVFALFLGFIAINPFGILDNISARFGKFDDFNSMTTGRYDIWIMYFERINSSEIGLLLGCGADARYVNGRAAHNMYIETIYKVGVIGLLIYTICYVSIIIYHRKTIKRNITNILGFLIIIVLYFFLAGFNAYELPFYLIVSLIAFNTAPSRDVAIL